MILTCPQCDTKYVVKDGAIPPGGRQVRCASCKHSWHQDPQGEDERSIAAAGPAGQAELGGPPTPATGEPAVTTETPPAATASDGVGIAPPQSEAEAIEAPAWDAPASDGLAAASVATSPGPEVVERPTDEQASAPLPPTHAEEPVDEDFAVHGFDDDDDDGARSGRLFKTVLMVLAAVGIAVAAFWYLAPDDWRARVGLAAADRSPLKIMLDTRDRQKLESGNELLAISGRVLNPTDEEQPVPAIRAELRNRQSQQLVHSWIIRPQARVLPPHGTTSFNSAEVDVPQGGDDISLSLGAD